MSHLPTVLSACIQVSALLEIWKLTRDDANTTLSTLPFEPSHHQLRLPEPPEMRQRLVKEIVFFVNYLKQKSAERRQSSNAVIEQNKNKHILHYVKVTCNEESNEACPDSENVNGGGSCVSVESDSCVSVKSGRWSSGSCSRSTLSSQDGGETLLQPFTPVVVDSK